MSVTSYRKTNLSGNDYLNSFNAKDLQNARIVEYCKEEGCYENKPHFHQNFKAKVNLFVCNENVDGLNWHKIIIPETAYFKINKTFICQIFILSCKPTKPSNLLIELTLILLQGHYKNQKALFSIPTKPNHPSEAMGHHLFTLAKEILKKSGGNNDPSYFNPVSLDYLIILETFFVFK